MYLLLFSFFSIKQTFTYILYIKIRGSQRAIKVKDCRFQLHCISLLISISFLKVIYPFIFFFLQTKFLAYYFSYIIASRIRSRIFRYSPVKRMSFIWFFTIWLMLKTAKSITRYSYANPSH